MRWGIVGAAQLPGPVRFIVDAAMHGLMPAPDEITYGCHGEAEALALPFGVGRWPKALHRLVVASIEPRAEAVACAAWAQQKGERGEARVLVEHVEGGLWTRNARLLDFCDGLLALPPTGQPNKGATWQAVEAARAWHKPIIQVVPLDGSKPWTETNG